MAQLVISAAGAALGFWIGGPQGALIGWSLGSALGGSMAPATKVQGSQQSLMDLTVTGTAYGQAIPYIRGAATVAGGRLVLFCDRSSTFFFRRGMRRV